MKNAKFHIVVLSIGTVALFCLGLMVLNAGFQAVAYVILGLALLWFAALASLSLYGVCS